MRMLLTYIATILFSNSYFNFQCQALTSSNSFSDQYNALYLPNEFIKPDNLRKKNKKLQLKNRRKRRDAESDLKVLNTTTHSIQLPTHDGTIQSLTFHRTQFLPAKGHTHAYINWAGKGTKIIFVLTLKKFTSYYSGTDKIKQSFLYRSDDYGKIWKEVSYESGTQNFPNNALLASYLPSGIKDGLLIFVDDQTVLPAMPSTNITAKGRIVVTLDKGVTWKSHLLPFKLSEFKFHPTEPDWLLGYDKKKKQLWFSKNIGKTWTSLNDPMLTHVQDKRWFWGVQNLEQPDIVHFEYRSIDRTKPTRFHYYVHSCHAENCWDYCDPDDPQSKNNCKDPNAENMKLGPIARDSLAVEGNYILVEKSLATSTGPKNLYTSFKRGSFNKAYFTSNEKFNRHHIVSAKNNFIILGVLHSDNTKSNLYISNSGGDVFWLTLPNINSNADKVVGMRYSQESYKVDCVTMPSLVGVIICNQINSTKISYTSGTEWSQISRTGQVKNQNKEIPAKTGHALHLHLSLKFTKKGYYMPKFYALGDGDYGYAYAHGQYLDKPPETPTGDNLGAYMTKDGGVSWNMILKDRHVFTAADYGRQILARNSKTFQEFTTLDFSWNYGTSFKELNFTTKKIQIDGILTEPGAHMPFFTIFGHPKTIGNAPDQSQSDAWHIITVDGSKVYPDKCTDDDYLTWRFKVPDDATCAEGKGKCLYNNIQPLGINREIQHQKPASNCSNNDHFIKRDAAQTVTQNSCKATDYTCGYLYELNGKKGTCQFNKSRWQGHNQHHDLSWFDEDTKRWPVKIPGDNCTDDLKWYNEEEFFKNNKAHLKNTGYGKGWKLIMKDKPDMKMMTAGGCMLKANEKDQPLGTRSTFKVGGQFPKLENMTFTWKKEVYKEDTKKWMTIKNETTTGMNEWRVYCGTVGINKLSVTIRTKDTKDKLFDDTTNLRCWDEIDKENLYVQCNPKVELGKKVTCRGLLVAEDSVSPWSDKDGDVSPSIKQVLDVDYKWDTSESTSAATSSGIPGKGKGIVKAFGSREFNTVTNNAYVELTVTNPVCSISKQFNVKIVAKNTKDDSSPSNKVIELMMEGYYLDLNSEKSIIDTIQLQDQIHDKINSVAGQTLKKSVFIADLVKQTTKNDTIVYVYLDRQDGGQLSQADITRFENEWIGIDKNIMMGNRTYSIYMLGTVNENMIDDRIDAGEQSSVWKVIGILVGVALTAVGIFYGVNYVASRKGYSRPQFEADAMPISDRVMTSSGFNNDYSDRTGIIEHDELQHETN